MVMLLSYEDIGREIVSRCASGRINLVAVDGPMGSGQAELVARLAPMLQAPVIPMQDFFSFGDLAQWWPRFEEQVLQPLATGQVARYQQRDWERDFNGESLDSWKKVERAPIIFLEGTSSSRLVLANQLTLGIWMEAPRAQRVDRNVEQFGEATRSQWEAWLAIEDDWFSEDNTRWRAELMLDGEVSPDVDLTRAVALLEQ